VSPKREKSKENTFTVSGMFTFSINRKHVVLFMGLVLLLLSLVLDDAALHDVVEFCGRLLVPPA
jgi:hypothetical protein